MSLFEFNEELHNRTIYEDGRDDERKSIITRMLERGKSPSDIADSTGISYDQIYKVQKQLLRVREE